MPATIEDLPWRQSPQGLGGRPGGQIRPGRAACVTVIGRPRNARSLVRRGRSCLRGLGQTQTTRPLVIDVDRDGAATIAGMPSKMAACKRWSACCWQTIPAAWSACGAMRTCPSPRRRVAGRVEDGGDAAEFTAADDGPDAAGPARFPHRGHAVARTAENRFLTERDQALRKRTPGARADFRAGRTRAGPRTARQDALAGLIASLGGIEKANVRLDAPAPSAAKTLRP